MGFPQARISDIGIGTCCCHSDPTCISQIGTLVTGSPNVNCNGLGISRITDVMLGRCGHVGIMVTGSFRVKGNGLGCCRLSDYFTGCFFGIIVTGSANVLTGF